MRHRIHDSSAMRIFAGTAALALIVAACGGSASPSPAASAAASQAGDASPLGPTPAPSAAPSQAGGAATGCADPTQMAAAMQGADHYVAVATITTPLPGDSVGEGIGMVMTMEFQKPDRMRVQGGLADAPGALFEMISIGQDSWIRMFGGGTWAKTDASASPSPSSNPDIFGSTFGSAGLEPLDTLPDGVDLPGSSSCVIAYTIKAPPAVAGQDSNPLGQLGSATAFAARVDTATGRPQSLAFIIDPAKVRAGSPAAIVFAFDYDTPVDISAPDPSTVVQGGGFPLPSGLVLPSGITIP